MIGIGILTWRRSELVRDKIISALLQHTTDDFALAISCNSEEALERFEAGLKMLRHVDVVDSLKGPVKLLGEGKNLGVAGGKNRIICWFLQNPHLEHLFLLEDDTWPIKKGWDIWYRRAHQVTGVQAVTFQPDDFYAGVTSHGPRAGQYEAVGTYVDGMMMLSATRKAIETVGGMHRNFDGINGQEHSEWMTRANRAGMTPFTNCSFMGCQEWLDGIDYQEWRHGKGLPGGVVRPAGDPAASQLYGPHGYDKGRETFFRTKKTHTIGRSLFQDPCWDEETAKEAPAP